MDTFDQKKKKTYSVFNWVSKPICDGIERTEFPENSLRRMMNIFLKKKTIRLMNDYDYWILISGVSGAYHNRISMVKTYRYSMSTREDHLFELESHSIDSVQCS